MVVFAIRVFTAKQMWVFVLCRCLTVSVHHRVSTLYKVHTALPAEALRHAQQLRPRVSARPMHRAHTVLPSGVAMRARATHQGLLRAVPPERGRGGASRGNRGGRGGGRGVDDGSCWVRRVRRRIGGGACGGVRSISPSPVAGIAVIRDCQRDSSGRQRVFLVGESPPSARKVGVSGADDGVERRAW